MGLLPFRRFIDDDEDSELSSNVSGCFETRRVKIGEKTLNRYRAARILETKPLLFTWGGGEGDELLSLALLIEFVDRRTALTLYKKFKRIISALPQSDFVLPADEILDFISGNSDSLVIEVPALLSSGRDVKYVLDVSLLRKTFIGSSDRWQSKSMVKLENGAFTLLGENNFGVWKIIESFDIYSNYKFIKARDYSRMHEFLTHCDYTSLIRIFSMYPELDEVFGDFKDPKYW